MQSDACTKTRKNSLVCGLGAVLALALGACAKPYLPPIIEPDTPEAQQFDGLLPLVIQNAALHVVWIHGMCPHSKADWADVRVASLAKRLGIGAQVSSLSSPIGEFVYRYELSYEGRPITLDMVVWSELIAERRASLCFDSVKAKDGVARDACGDKAKYPHKRATLNDALKSGLMNACLADAMIYIGDQGGSIRERIRPDVEAALGSGTAAIAPAVVFVSESLGSKVLYDVLREIMHEPRPSILAQRAQATVSNTRQLVMFANQVPILDLTGPPPADVRALGAQATQGEGSGLRGFVEMLQRPDNRARRSAQGIDRLKVVAYSDPNDVLSYRLPKGYFRESDKTDAVNVLPSNDNVWFGVFENPLQAHLGYEDTDDVMKLFLCGNPPAKECLSGLKR
jgi:hypothetical protein